MSSKSLKTMKRTLMILLFFGFAIQGMAQSSDDRAQVLQKCIDLQQLQLYYPRDARGAIKQLKIMQHGISFPENINVSKNGVRPAFLSKKEVSETGMNAYFLFHEFTISETVASVAFIYHYSEADQLVVTLELEKTGSNWSVKKSNASIDHETK